MRAALYHRTSAAGKGWDVVLEHTDQTARRGDPWPGRRHLADDLQAGQADVLLVQSIHRLLRGPYDLVDHIHHWLRAGIHLVATDDTIAGLPVDTTHPAAGLRIRDAIALLAHLRTAARREVGRATAALSTHPAPGRPRALVNDLELLALTHDGLSIREIVHRLDRRGAPASYGTVQARLAALRAAGRIDQDRRQKAIDQRGGLRKGGRPKKRR